MNYRINTKVIFSVLVLMLIVVALFVYILAYAPTDDEGNTSVDATTTASESVQQKIITAKHKYEDGVHIIAGKAEVPTPCHRLFAEPFYTDTENKDNIVIKFNTVLEGEECVNQISSAPFNVSFEASENANITATWNGDKVKLNLIPLQPGETIDSEIYIKG